MSTVQELISRAKVVFPAAILIMVIGYFTYHSIQGDKGIFSYIKLKHKVTVARAALDEIHLEKKALEIKVRGLRHTSLDLDLLEERAGAALNLMRSDDLLLHFSR